MTQKTAVMEYLRTHDSITPMEAFSELGVTKLATIVSDLIRHDNAKIIKRSVKIKNRYGRPCHFMQYSLEE